MHRTGEKTRSVTRSPRVLPVDTVEFCREWLHYEPFEYNWPFLMDDGHFIANLMARQTGKTFNGMAKLLYYAFKYPNSVILVTAPKLDQVKNIAFNALHQHIRRMESNDKRFFDYVIGNRNILRTVIRFRNGSQILAESPIPETIRGHTAKVVYLMECNFIREDEDLYSAVLFTLNTTNGYLIAESTPWNTDSVFHKMFHDPQYNKFSTHVVDYTKAMAPHGPLNPEFVDMIKQQLVGDPIRWKREMLCEWTEDTDRWLPASLIALCQDTALRYYSAEKRHRGRFYAGVDFGKKQDHSVVAIVEAKIDHLHLRHCHQFKLDTPYGVVIGYIKRLQDNWNRLASITCDQTGVGDYIVEDMKRVGVRNVEGVTFTETSKETMATALKETMRTAECPHCSWRGYIETLEGEWTTTCLQGCTSSEGNPQTLTPLLHIPYDPELINELNTPTYQLAKTGKIQYSHPAGTHDDRFWATALAVYSITEKRANKPIAKR
ncbi:terminase family protein [Candidatus Bathyarchaeota archaeon]|nr:terminase family protein [Candidatus Bathyarchaeota archaeon]